MTVADVVSERVALSDFSTSLNEPWSLAKPGFTIPGFTLKSYAIK